MPARPPAVRKQRNPHEARHASLCCPPPIPNSLNKSTFGLAPTRDVTRRVKLARVSVMILGVQTRVKLICPLRLRSISPVTLKPLLSSAQGNGATLVFFSFIHLRETNI